jgi:hypothetical protein
MKQIQKSPKFSSLIQGFTVLLFFVLGLVGAIWWQSKQLPDSDKLVHMTREFNPWSTYRPPAYKKAINRIADTGIYCLQDGVGQQNWVPCLYNFLDEISAKYGARVGLDVAVRLAEIDPRLNHNSHDLAHIVGNGALKFDYQVSEEDFTGINLVIQRMGRALADCHSWGVMGCMHGVIEAGFLDIPDNQRTNAVMAACLDNPSIQGNQVFVNHCLHWLGHGIVIYTSDTLEQILATCESLDPNFQSNEVQLCLSGVFHAGSDLGNFEELYKDNIYKVFSESDPLYPCMEIPERFRQACFGAMPGRLEGQLQAISDTCALISDRDASAEARYKEACYTTMGNVVLNHELKSPAGVAALCDQYSDSEYVQFCYAGAARYWFLRMPEFENRLPIELCTEVAVQHKNVCYRALGFVVWETAYNKDHVDVYCESINEPEFISICTSLSK